jgi:hypothetical protein
MQYEIYSVVVDDSREENAERGAVGELAGRRFVG